MTVSAAGASDLDPSWWSSQVVPSKAVATCSSPVVFSVQAQQSPTAIYLRVVSTRTVDNLASGRSGTQPVEDSRKLLLQPDGRWLVDVRIEGG